MGNDVFDELDAGVFFKASGYSNRVAFTESPGGYGLRAGVDGGDSVVAGDEVEGRPCVGDVGLLEGVVASRPGEEDAIGGVVAVSGGVGWEALCGEGDGRVGGRNGHGRRWMEDG